MIKVKITGSIDLDPAMINVEERSTRAVRLASEYILQQSKRNIPHDTGLLENSGATDYEYFSRKARAMATVFYDTPYAVVVHEDQTRNYRNGRQAKYLEDAVRDSVAKVRAIMIRELRRAFD